MVGVGEAVGGDHRVVGLMAAALQVADPVERRDDLADEARVLFEHAFDGVGVDVGEPVEPAHLVEIDEVIEDERDVSHRRAVVGHAQTLDPPEQPGVTGRLGWASGVEVTQAMIELEQREQVWLLRMGNGENRFNRDSIDALHGALDQVEAVEGPVALVTTGAGKFYSNGLDLDWLMGAGDGTAGFLDDVHRLLGRVLGFGAITVAAVNGHAFAGGAMLAAAHDYMVMREDRGYWCLPEVDLGLPLTPAMYAVVAAHLPPSTLREAALTGRRYAAPEAVAAGIADQAVGEADVVERAVALAAGLAEKNREVIGVHKRLMYGEALATCGV